MNKSKNSISVIDALLFVIASIVHQIKGPSQLVELKDDIDAIESLIGFSHHGYRIQIHCKEINYLCKYKRSFIPDKKKSIYKVYADISDNAPVKLKRFCGHERHFPKLLFSWFPSSTQREAAIRAYLDLLIKEIKTTA